MSMPDGTMAYWTVFAWYMGGAVLRGIWGWMTWVQQGETPWTHQAARSVKVMIGSAIVAFVWTGSHLWNLLAWLNMDIPFQVGVSPLSSLAAGFILEMVLVERVIGRIDKKD
jgi:peptidoglycan biosynthesis protein MviN/MurJ (putative lipid II flippase)